TKVVILDLFLCFLNLLCDGLVVNLLSFRNPQRLVDIHHTLGTEQTHQIIFQRKEELGLSRVSLTSGTTSELIINSAALMALRTDDLQATQFCDAFSQLNIGTTTGHVGGNGHGSALAGVRDDLRLQ